MFCVNIILESRFLIIVSRGKKIWGPYKIQKAVPTRLQCSQGCSRSLFHRTYNFCSNTICQFNLNEFHNSEPSLLIPEAKCDYYGMKAEPQLSFIYNENTLADIQGDEKLRICGKNYKRIDQFCVEWSIEETLIEYNPHWKSRKL